MFDTGSHRADVLIVGEAQRAPSSRCVSARIPRARFCGSRRAGPMEWTAIRTIYAIQGTSRPAMENTPDGDDAYHGRTGPFPIRHEKYDGLTPSLRGFIDACVAEGYPRVEDPGSSGTAKPPSSAWAWSRAATRSSAAAAWQSSL